MLDFLATYGMFLLKVATIVIATLLVVAGVISLASKNKIKPKEKITIRKLNDKYRDMRIAINEETLPKIAFKKLMKEGKISEKKEMKKSKALRRKRIFVLNFKGDMKAQAVENLREEITAILTAATAQDEVLVRIESPGGMIQAYGLGASQLQRIRERKVPLVVVVDKVAASGGYLMACVADKILAAPFAILGSIGVVAELPNFNRLLKKHDIAYEQITAGEYKRTLSLFGENTVKGREKMQAEVEEAHRLFKKFVAENRPKVAINKISTGEHWYGSRALQLKLIDGIMTSDDYLLSASETANIYEVTYTVRKSLSERFALSAQSVLNKLGLALQM